ncbi:MAG: hypothetical protein BWY31_04298 [Lentisphaerae bacterium ADurb.Bin242]|nr:MAG: hypothetical protein BWY31_04298 [Lentisphaerae bacterium ADurb.Bin242]
MRKRFTLIELLIVISIIAILAGMLLPALNKAKQTAVGIQCLGQQKSIGIMLNSYCSDSNDILPLSNFLNPSWEAYTFQIKLSIQNYNVTYSEAVSFALKTKRGKYPWTCPADPKNWGDWNAGATNFLGNYSLNSDLLGYGNDSPADIPKIKYMKSNMFKMPSQCGVLWDGPIPQPGEARYLHRATNRAQTQWQIDSIGCVDYSKHNNKTNVLFFDGHAEAKKL